jgi:hypothetical protein
VTIGRGFAMKLENAEGGERRLTGGCCCVFGLLTGSEKGGESNGCAETTTS